MENRRGNQEWKIQRHGQHWAQLDRTKTKQTQKTKTETKQKQETK